MNGDERPLPLSGVRVIDITAAWAGPFACQLLADLGAEVIRVENTHIWQAVTRSFAPRPTRTELETQPAWSGGYPDMEPGERPWNRCPGYINLFRNKVAMTCDLRTPRGKEVLARLVRISDVFYENNATDLMDKLGITYEWLAGLNPGIIYIRAPGFGSTGDRAHLRAYGTQVEAVMGHTLLRGYRDLDPTSTSIIYTSDEFSGLHGAFAVMAALNARRRTGRGQLIEIPQAECGMAMLAEAFLDCAMNGRVHRAGGNRDIHGTVQGVYACRGDDRWIAITVATDGEWAGLCAAMGQPELALDERFATPAARLAHHDEIDVLIAGWSREHDARALFLELQRLGVMAGPVLTAKDACEDPHVAERGYFETVTHPDTGTFAWPGMPFKLSETPLHIRRPPRGLGEDNEYVYRTLLGYSGEEYAELEHEGHIGTEFDQGLR